MRIAYICHTRYPTEKAHGRQMTEVCHAMAQNGHTVTLVTPSMHTPITESPYSYYDVANDFMVEQVRHTDTTQWSWFPGRLRFPLALFLYGGALKKLSSLAEADLLYVRSPWLVCPLASHGVPVMLELHSLPSSPKKSFLRACSHASTIICLTAAQQTQLLLWGIPQMKIVAEGDAVDLDRFNNLPSKEQAKKQYGLPDDRPVIGYVGGLLAIDMDKGVDVILDAVSTLKQQRTPSLAWIVGGSEEQQRPLQERAELLGLTEGSDVIFKTRVSPKDVPSALSCADILVYPAPKSDHPYFQRDTSPLKLFEYMAAKRPIAAADLPPLHDVVTDADVWFYEPGSGSGLATSIQNILNDSSGAEKKVQRAAEIVRQHTWKKRMERILKTV